MGGPMSASAAETVAGTRRGTAHYAPDALGSNIGGRMESVGAPAPAIRLEGVTAGYGERIALECVDLEIPVGALVAVVGPNGGGKSTLLKLIAGVLKPWTGSVEVLGAAAGREAHRVAYVPQAELVDWSFPVNVWERGDDGPLSAPGAAAASLDMPITRPWRRRWIASGCWTELGRRSGRCRGGQRRRAFLARAMAAEVDLYLLDEPVTGVDVPTQEAIMALLAAEAEKGKAGRSHHARSGRSGEALRVDRGCEPPDHRIRPAALLTNRGNPVADLRRPSPRAGRQSGHPG